MLGACKPGSRARMDSRTGVALTATLWHTLALSGSLLLSNFAYTARFTGSLLSSHCRCHDDALYPALVLLDIRQKDLMYQLSSSNVLPLLSISLTKTLLGIHLYPFLAPFVSIFNSICYGNTIFHDICHGS